jgi:hypothetical protein
MRAYPYDVELRLDNGNTKETTIRTHRVYAYNVLDAMTQATVEASVDAGSADIKILRVAPPLECCALELLEKLSETLKSNEGGLASTLRKVTR